MSEELQKKLLEIINTAEKAGAEAFLFTKEQVPDIIQQFLLWKLIHNLFMATVALASAYFLVRHVYPWVVAESKKDFLNQSGALPPAIIFGGGTMFFSVLGVIVFASNALQIWLAPKVYLLEYLKDLVK